MKRNFEYSHGWRIEHLYRMMQGLSLSVLILTQWGQINYSIIALLFLVGLTIYQLLIFSLSSYLHRPSSRALIAISRVIDSLVVGIFYELTSHNLILSVAIIISFGVTCVNFSVKKLLLSVIGFVTGIVLVSRLELPPLVITELIQTFIIIVLISFMLGCEIVKNCFYKRLYAEYQSISRDNQMLKQQSFRLSKYLSPTHRKEILAGKEVRVTAQEKALTLFFSDMQGFSEMSEQLTPEQLTGVINSYLTEMSEIVFRFGGTLDKVIGDSLMVFFGDPDSRGRVNDATACVCMALAMREAMQTLRARWKSEGIKKPPCLRMGIHSGTCKVGNFGTDNRLEYTALGTAVNLASHLESSANANEIVISQQTKNLVEHLVYCVKRDPVKVKGFSTSMPAFSAVEIIKDKPTVPTGMSKR